MACLLFVLFGSGGWFLFFIPVSSISVDVNPSVELGVNRFDRVVTVETYNDDGQDIMSSLNVRFMDYRDALDKILDLESREAYLAEDSCIAITVSGAASKGRCWRVSIPVHLLTEMFTALREAMGKPKRPMLRV